MNRHPPVETRNDAPPTGGRALAEALAVSFRLLRFLMFALLVLYFFSGAFSVPQHERAFVLIFGQLKGLGADRIRSPGFHWTWPAPIAEVVRVPAARVQTVETTTFWPAIDLQLEGAPPRPTLNPARDGYALTGDANILHSRWAVRFTLDDAEAWAFDFDQGAAILRNELDRAAILATGRFTIDQALRTDIESFRAAVERELVRRCDALGLGVRVQNVELLALQPPRPALDAFSAVIEAEQERSRAISAARAYAARTLNEAEGDAARLRAEGAAYRQRLVAVIQADADYFKRVLPAYERAPDVVARTLRQDILRRVLSGVDAKYLVPADGSGRRELRLMLGPEKLAPVGSPTGQP